ncbi:LOW QUALITY PROTEIN: flavin-containing monooxygenase 5-like [Pangshura tecta]
MAQKRAAVIGAGFCGLSGLEPTCFERSGDIGGLWRFEENPKEGRASIYKSVIINTSKEMMCFSDFPIPADFPNYMHKSKIMEYFRMYANLFNLLKYICFKTTVVSVTKCPDFSTTGQWDIVTETVFLSTRRGAWILGRIGEEGYSMDTLYITRYVEFLRHIVPLSLLNYFADKKLNAKFNHAIYGLQPAHRLFSQHPTINDDLPNCIISGKVLVKPNIRAFTETSAIFEDGTREEDIDVVVFAMGYSLSFPFLGDCAKVIKNQVSLYKFVFPPQLEKPTLAFIGLIQPLGAIMPIAELQGLNGLPSASNMMTDIAQEREEMAKQYVKSQHYTIQMDYIPYMDEAACQAGVKPKLLSLFLMDPKLAVKVFFGPCTPYQYRLRGPGKWDGARKAILTQRERIIKPLKTRVLDDYTGALVPYRLQIFLIVALIAVTFAYFSWSFVPF